jgi:uncharacterized protein YndB with AHSA1/START domain
MFPTTHVFTFATTAPPWDVWSALTDADTPAHFFDGASLRSSWEVGERIELEHDGATVGSGEVLASERWDRLAYTLEGGDGSDTYLTWSVRNIPTGSIARLYIDEMDDEPADDVEAAWMPLLRRLQVVLTEGQKADRTTAR